MFRALCFNLFCHFPLPAKHTQNLWFYWYNVNQLSVRTSFLAILQNPYILVVFFSYCIIRSDIYTTPEYHSLDHILTIRNTNVFSIVVLSWNVPLLLFSRHMRMLSLRGGTRKIISELILRTIYWSTFFLIFPRQSRCRRHANIDPRKPTRYCHNDTNSKYVYGGGSRKKSRHNFNF